MKNILFTLALLVCFNSFGQLDSNGKEYGLSRPTLNFNHYPVVVNDDGVYLVKKKYLIKALKCNPLIVAGRKYKIPDGLIDDSFTNDGVAKHDVNLKVVSFEVSISGKVVKVIGNSIGYSSIAKNLLDKAKAGDTVIFFNVNVRDAENIKGKLFYIRTSYMFGIL